MTTTDSGLSAACTDDLRHIIGLRY